MAELDDEFKENYLQILKRFWLLFESIYKYFFDLNQYITDVEEGVYISSTLEVRPQNSEKASPSGRSICLPFSSPGRGVYLDPMHGMQSMSRLLPILGIRSCAISLPCSHGDTKILTYFVCGRVCLLHG